MGVTCSLQDAPPPRGSSPSQDKKAEVKHAATNCQLPVPLQELLSSNKLEHVFTEDGRERVRVIMFYNAVILAVLVSGKLIYS